jgi:hypothetical protein
MLVKALNRINQARFPIMQTSRLFSRGMEVPEAELIPQDQGLLDTENDFQDWLKQGMPDQTQGTPVVGKGGLRTKRKAFYKLGYNENHIDHQGGYKKAKK